MNRLFISLPLLLSAHLAIAEAEPNIIFILSDDIAQGDLGCYGQKLIQTPNLDRMARGGNALHAGVLRHNRLRPVAHLADDGFAHGACACPRKSRDPAGRSNAPARRHVHGCATVAKRRLSTACVGKWGMGMFDTTGSPLKTGFDHFFGYNCQRHAHTYFPKYLYNDDQRFELPGNDGNEKITGKGAIYSQDLIADEALKFVRENKDRPFFLYYAITLPHGTTQINDQGIYKDKPWTEEQKKLCRHGDAPRHRCRAPARAAEGTRYRRKDPRDSCRRQWFIVRAELGTWANFSSRRPTGCAAYKRELYEGGLRKAGIVALAWRGGRRARERRAMGLLGFPADLRGAGRRENPRRRAARTGFRWCLSSKAARRRNESISIGSCTRARHSRPCAGAIGKLFARGPSKPIEIYDLKTDAAESRNLALERPDLVAKAESLMKAAHGDDPNWPLLDVRSRRAKASSTKK